MDRGSITVFDVLAVKIPHVDWIYASYGLADGIDPWEWCSVGHFPASYHVEGACADSSGVCQMWNVSRREPYRIYSIRLAIK